MTVFGASANNSIGECVTGISCERAPSGLARWFGGPVMQDPEGLTVGNWRKSSFCVTNECVEAGSWRKSSFCAASECVEVGHGPPVIGVRDSALPGSPVLEFDAAAWRRFLGKIKAGN